MGIKNLCFVRPNFGSSLYCVILSRMPYMCGRMRVSVFAFGDVIGLGSFLKLYLFGFRNGFIKFMGYEE